MNNISTLYNDILKKIPFSICGSEDSAIEDKIFDTLNNLSTSNFNISFLMGGFAKIKLDSIAKIFGNEWKTEKLKAYYFNDLKRNDSEGLLAVYQYIISFLTNNQKNSTNIFCDNNYGGLNFNISISSKIKKINIVHDNRNDCIEVLIPKDFFNKNFDYDTFKEEITKLDKPFSNSSKKNILFPIAFLSDYSEVIKIVFSEKFSLDSYKFKPVDYVLSSFAADNFKKEVLRNESANMDELYYLILAFGIICFMRELKIDFFTSVVKTHGYKKYSLGTLAIGYIPKKLNLDCKAGLAIITNHIAANLSAQILINSTDMQYYQTKRKEQVEFIKNFIIHYGLELNIPHNGKANGTIMVVTNNEIDINSSEYSFNSIKYSKIEIENSFGKGIIEYLSQVIKSKNLDWGMYEGFHGNAVCCNEINLFYKKFFPHDCDGLGLILKQNQEGIDKSDKVIEKPIANVYLPHLLVKTIFSDDNHPTENIITKNENCKAIIMVIYKNEIDIKKLVTALSKDGANGSFKSFLTNNYDAFRICGDLVIKDKNNTFLLSLKNDFKKQTINDKISFVFIGNMGPIINTKELIFEIHYNLF
jgi:hypothetical protein